MKNNLDSMLVCGVIVTYNNRFQLVKQTIEYLTQQKNVYKIVVVDNNSTQESRSNLIKLKDRLKERLLLIHHSENKGSSKGFFVGLQFAYKINECDFIWMLDDDNRPEKNALEALLKFWQKLEMDKKEKKIALCSLRVNRSRYLKAAEGRPIRSLFPGKNSYLGFSILDIPWKIMNRLWKLKGKNKLQKKYVEKVEIPVGPFGGLFIHKKIINTIGYPREDFFVYSDDTEYTQRIVKNSGKIFLIPSSRIIDIESSSSVQKPKSQFHTFFYDYAYKVYYIIRNTVFMSETDNKNNLLYRINKALYKSLLHILGKNKPNFNIIFQAINDGESHKLGINNSINFRTKIPE